MDCVLGAVLGLGIGAYSAQHGLRDCLDGTFHLTKKSAILAKEKAGPHLAKAHEAAMPYVKQVSANIFQQTLLSERTETRNKVATQTLRKAVTKTDMSDARSFTKPSSLESIQLVHFEAEEFTEKQLDIKPTGNDDAAVLPHVLKALAGDSPVTFGRHGETNASAHTNPLQMLHALGGESENKTEWEMKLDAPPKWCEARTVQELLSNRSAKQQFEGQCKKRIAESLGVCTGCVQIISITAGSVNVKFTVSDLTAFDKERILKEDSTQKLRKQFDTFASLKISPAVLALHFNLDDLDSRGNKTSDSGSTFNNIGGRTYHQPRPGWIRYGLKVRGKYPDGDSWLHPFQHQGNWWRGFHGTNMSKKIADEGFKASTGGKLGAGVYISPFVEYACSYSRGGVTIETQQGKKQFLIVLQVAVRPHSLKKEGYPNHQGENQEWTADATNVRPYGLLIKEQ